MDQELDTLAERTRELLALVRRLAEDNQRLRSEKERLHADQAQLRAELAASMEARGALHGRMAQARAKVETALSRLPAPGAQTQDEIPDGEH